MSQGHPGHLGRFLWKFQFKGQQNVRRTDGTYDGTDGTFPRDRRDTPGDVPPNFFMFIGFLPHCQVTDVDVDADARAISEEDTLVFFKRIVAKLHGMSMTKEFLNPKKKQIWTLRFWVFRAQDCLLCDRCSVGTRHGFFLSF